MVDKDVGILVIGGELLDGRVVDTNSRWIARELGERGIKLKKIVTVPDETEAIKNALNFLLPEISALIVTGGLGPTEDDITREVLAEYTRRPLKFHPEIEEKIRGMFAARKRPYADTNRKQAFVPDGAIIISNEVGSAPGFYLEYDHNSTSKIIAAFPGVPAELYPMFSELVPVLTEKLGASIPVPEIFFGLFGVPESKISEQIQSLKIDPIKFEVTYRASMPEIHLLIRARSYLAPESELMELRSRVGQALGAGNIFSYEKGLALPESVARELLKRKASLAVAESCTGGLLSKYLTDMGGASEYFLGGAITYSNASKSDLINVPGSLIEAHGAVSREVAEAMAIGTKKRFGSEYALSITGVAGPGGGSEEKPVGTFWIGFLGPRGVSSEKFFYPGVRGYVRTLAAYCALQKLRLELQSS